MSADLLVTFRLKCMQVSILNSCSFLYLWKFFTKDFSKRTYRRRRLLYFPTRLPFHLNSPVNTIHFGKAVIIRQFVYYPKVDEERRRHAEYKTQHIDGRKQETPLYKPKRNFHIMLYHLLFSYFNYSMVNTINSSSGISCPFKTSGYFSFIFIASRQV